MIYKLRFKKICFNAVRFTFIICITCSQYSFADTQNNNCEELILDKAERKLSVPESKPSAGRNERLIIGATKSFEVIASRRMNFSGIFLEKGTYIFTYSRLEDWCDASVPAGVSSADADSMMPRYHASFKARRKKSFFL